MKMTVSTWMNKDLISQATRIFDSIVYLACSADEKRVAEEGLAVMKKATPEYLINILPDDHPDRLSARNMLIEYENEMR